MAVLQGIPPTDRNSQIKVLVVGDAGVGKTSFCSLYCNKEVIKPSPTVGCSIEVKLVDRHFVEFWDISGASVYDSTRRFLYEKFHGAILIHDLTIPASYESLRRWATELSESGEKVPTFQQVQQGKVEYVVEIGSDLPSTLQRVLPGVPVVVIGTKADLRRTNGPSDVISELELNLTSATCLDDGTPAGDRLASFLNRVIERKLFPHLDTVRSPLKTAAARKPVPSASKEVSSLWVPERPSTYRARPTTAEISP